MGNTQARLVQALLEAGARTDIRNKDDCTVSDLAEIQQVSSAFFFLATARRNSIVEH